jgi:hypothetical protein
MKSELFLDRLGGKPDLPADMALSLGNPPVDESQLDAIGVIKREPVRIGCGKVLAAPARGPEILDRALISSGIRPPRVVVALPLFCVSAKVEGLERLGNKGVPVTAE